MKHLSLALIISSSGGFLMNACQSEEKAEPRRPNILIAISDDQSFPHTSFAGCRFVNTPGFDRIATEGVYFTNCIAGSPGCAPSRSSLVTGRYHWQNEQSGQHASSWLNKYVPYIDLLEAAGYHSGFTGKGVGPFQYKRSEADSLWRKDNAAGKPFNRFQYTKGESSDERTAEGIVGNNYFANFVDFLRQRQTGQPFYFWYGSSEPHRDYEKDSWKRNGKNLDMVDVPGFYPDSEEIRGDMLDYAVEIEWFDLHLTRMLNYLDSLGELENTIVIVTSDNGMPFPRAKANCFDFGIHVPLAVRYPKVFAGNRIVNDPVSFVDIAPTLLELTGTLPDGMMPMSGRSFVNILKSKKSGIVDETRKYVFAGRERHSSSRWNNLGYPQRAIRSVNHLLIWNIKSERWPAGAPQRLKPGSDKELLPMFGIDEKGIHHSEWAFADVDAAPAKSFLIENHNNEAISRYFDLSFGKRPEFELYDIVSDPYCLDNLYGVRDYLQIAQEMISVLMNELEKSADPRVVGPDTEIFDTYIRYSPMREFPVPDWASVD
jgi:N-sulfoglucosamine sulfohydrolase